MGQRKKKANNWSELCPDLLRCVFKRLSFTALNRAKSVCSSWHSASIGCNPNRNRIPWLILFPRSEETNNNSCVLYVPDDKDKVYKTRDLGVEFSQSRCLTTCGSWLLMSNPIRDLYILNPLTGERINLPDTNNLLRAHLEFELASFWIDNKTKDYLVIWTMSYSTIVFVKKGDNKWHQFPLSEWYKDSVFHLKDQKLYHYRPNYLVNIWDFSGVNPRQDDDGCCLPYFWFNHYDFPSWLNEDEEELYWQKLVHTRTSIAVTVSGEVLFVACIMFSCKTWHFRIYKTTNHQPVKIDSLGDEALIYDMGITVLAKDIPGIKRNSIYFSGLNHDGIDDDPNHIFVYDLTTQKMETLPQHVFSSSIGGFSDARWFFPC